MNPFLAGFADELVKLGAHSQLYERSSVLPQMSNSILSSIYGSGSGRKAGRIMQTPFAAYNRSPTSLTTPNPMMFYPTGST